MTFDVSAVLCGVPWSLRNREPATTYGPGDIDLRKEVEAERLISRIVWKSASPTHSVSAG